MARAGGRAAAADGDDKPDPGIATDEPLAEWEKELLVRADASTGDADQPPAAPAEPTA
jgi:small subunit ribosomal protein S2